jgi:hypothetical protein
MDTADTLNLDFRVLNLSTSSVFCRTAFGVRGALIRFGGVPPGGKRIESSSPVDLGKHARLRLERRLCAGLGNRRRRIPRLQGWRGKHF